MTASTFDTLAATRELKAAGIEAEHAEAIAGAMRQDTSADRDEVATKADLDTAITTLETRMTALEARMTATLYRALWFQGGAIIAILIALRFLPL